MDNIDILHNVGCGLNQRHVSINSNKSCWLSINSKLINKNTKHVIQKNKYLLNRKSMQHILNCVKYHIRINPILIDINDDDVKQIIKASVESNNVYYMNIICNLYGVDYNMIHNCTLEKNTQFLTIGEYSSPDYISWSLITGFNVIKFMVTKYNVTKNNLDISNLFLGAISNNNFNIVKYMNKIFNLSHDDINVYNYQHMYVTPLFYDGYILILKYLIEKMNIQFNKWDLLQSIYYNQLNIIQYMLQKTNYDKPQIMTLFKIACQTIAIDIKIVKYLQSKGNLTSQDIQKCINKHIISKLTENNRNDILDYLQEHIKIE